MPAHEENDNIHLHQAISTVIKLQDNLQSANGTIAAQQGEVATLQRDMKSANDTIAAQRGEVATLQHDMKSAKDTIAAQQGEVATLQRDMKSANKTIATLRADMKSTQDTFQSVTRTGKPLIFKLTEYQKKRYNNEMTMSPSFYTSPEGYHMCLQIYANGNGDGKQTHVSAYVPILKGKHDNTLKWPFVGNYFFELLNQLENKNHHIMSLNLTASKHKAKVGPAWGYDTFIPHFMLSCDTSKRIQYLKDDALYFRLTVTQSDHKSWLDYTP